MALVRKSERRTCAGVGNGIVIRSEYNSRCEIGTSIGTNSLENGFISHSRFQVGNMCIRTLCVNFVGLLLSASSPVQSGISIN